MVSYRVLMHWFRYRIECSYIDFGSVSSARALILVPYRVLVHWFWYRIECLCTDFSTISSARALILVPYQVLVHWFWYHIKCSCTGLLYRSARAPSLASYETDSNVAECTALAVRYTNDRTWFVVPDECSVGQSHTVLYFGVLRKKNGRFVRGGRQTTSVFILPLCYDDDWGFEHAAAAMISVCARCIAWQYSGTHFLHDFLPWIVID